MSQFDEYVIGASCATNLSTNDYGYVDCTATVYATVTAVNQNIQNIAEQWPLNDAQVNYAVNQQTAPQSTFHSPITPRNQRTSQQRSNSKSKLTSIKRRSRQNFTPKQIEALERVFEQSTHYPDWTTLTQLAKQLKLPPERAQVWFQNRRAKFRRNANSNHDKH